jgi:hypothetical protein
MNNPMHRILAVGLALGLPAGMASAKSMDKKATWGAATAVAGLGAVLQARDHPLTAAVLAAGAVYSYTQYDKARSDDRDGRYSDDYRGAGDSRYDSDPYGYSRAPGYTTGRADANYNSRTKEVTGEVTSDTGAFDRSIKVRLDDGRQRTIDVPKKVTIRRDSRNVSVHDLKKGDVVRVKIDRFRTDGSLEARRVDVLQRADDRYDNDSRNNDDYYNRSRDNGRNDSWNNSYDRNVTEGTVSSIDSRNGILRIRVNGRTLDVDVRNSDIRDDRGSMSLRDLQNGDRVTVTGPRNGDTIRASRVTVGY